MKLNVRAFSVPFQATTSLGLDMYFHRRPGHPPSLYTVLTLSPPHHVGRFKFISFILLLLLLLLGPYLDGVPGHCCRCDRDKGIVSKN